MAMSALTSNAPARFSWSVTPVVGGILRLSDIAVLLAAGVAAHWIQWTPNTPFWSHFRWPELSLLIVGVLLTVQVYELSGLYTRPPGILLDLTIVRAHLIVSACLAGAALFLNLEAPLTPIWILYWLILTLGGVLGLRAAIWAFVRRWPSAAHVARNVAIVGTPELTVRMANNLAAASDPSVRLVGLFQEPPSASAQDRPFAQECPFPVIGGSGELVSFARQTPVDEVIIAIPWHAEDQLAGWLDLLCDLPCKVLLCPPEIRGITPKCAVEVVGGMPLLKVAERPLSGWGYIIKAIEDRLMAALLVLALAPLMLIIAILIQIDSPGPVLFRQKRHGFNNNVIDVLKFRTMSADESQTGIGKVDQATIGDPRVTGVGRWLRRTSLDELPQLFNVLRGEMSLVGPRPHAVSHNEQYAKVISAYRSRHRVKPGITGWAQVNGFRGQTDTLDKMEMRVRLDRFYIDNWSLLLDHLILVRTLTVFFNRNAY